jgi:hypothetical protein
MQIKQIRFIVQVNCPYIGTLGVKLPGPLSFIECELYSGRKRLCGNG